MESGKQPGNKIQQKYRKYGIYRNIIKDIKEGHIQAKSKIWRNQATKTKTKNKMMKYNVESDGEDDGKIREQ